MELDSKLVEECADLSEVRPFSVIGRVRYGGIFVASEYFRFTNDIMQKMIELPDLALGTYFRLRGRVDKIIESMGAQGGEFIAFSLNCSGSELLMTIETFAGRAAPAVPLGSYCCATPRASQQGYVTYSDSPPAEITLTQSRANVRCQLSSPEEQRKAIAAAKAARRMLFNLETAIHIPLSQSTHCCVTIADDLSS